jgi:threonine dehydrogenase-like Zn-dependent dehydrogenase
MNPLALWCTAPKTVELLPAAMGEGVLVETLFTGVSRGTERLVFEGRVPEAEHERMRAPGQEGEFPFPVKYGYSSVCKVMEGQLSGQLVFSLHPHQNTFRKDPASLNLIPDYVPAERAVLAANMETALNILWDSGAQAGDRIAVIGAGVIGAMVAYLASKLPGSEVTLIDTNLGRKDLAEGLGASFSSPNEAEPNCDVVIHTSGSTAGANLALRLAGKEASVIEASWFGDAEVNLKLGEGFHSQRLKLTSSQVGSLPTSRAPRWSHQRRLTKALELLADPALDALISGESSFNDLPTDYSRILQDPDTLCHRVRY